MINAEVERQWQKRLNEWAKQRAARKKLMNDVLQTRRRQVEERCKYCENRKTVPYFVGRVYITSLLLVHGWCARMLPTHWVCMLCDHFNHGSDHS